MSDGVVMYVEEMNAGLEDILKINFSQIDAFDFNNVFIEFLTADVRDVHLYFDYDDIQSAGEYESVYSWLMEISKVFGCFSVGGYCNNKEMEKYGFKLIEHNDHYLSFHVVFFETKINRVDLAKICKTKPNIYMDPRVYRVKNQKFRHVLSNKFFGLNNVENTETQGYILNGLKPHTQIVQLKGDEECISEEAWRVLFDISVENGVYDEEEDDVSAEKKSPLVICVEKDYEVLNGFSGLMRDVILRLLHIVRLEHLKVRMVFGMAKNHLKWRFHQYFKKSRNKLEVPFGYFPDPNASKHSCVLNTLGVFVPFGQHERTFFLNPTLTSGVFRIEIRPAFGYTNLRMGIVRKKDVSHIDTAFNHKPRNSVFLDISPYGVYLSIGERKVVDEVTGEEDLDGEGKDNGGYFSNMFPVQLPDYATHQKIANYLNSVFPAPLRPPLNNLRAFRTAAIAATAPAAGEVNNCGQSYSPNPAFASIIHGFSRAVVAMVVDMDGHPHTHTRQRRCSEPEAEAEKRKVKEKDESENERKRRKQRWRRRQKRRRYGASETESEIETETEVVDVSAPAAALIGSVEKRENTVHFFVDNRQIPQCVYRIPREVAIGVSTGFTGTFIQSFRVVAAPMHNPKQCVPYKWR